jgi:GNAT superfamily N-acetyltransferase
MEKTGVTRRPGDVHADTVSIVEPVPLELTLEGYTSRPLRRTDAAALVELMHAYERLHLGRPFVDLADIEGDWQRPSNDLASGSVGVFAGHRLVASAEVSARRAEVFVHPDRCGLGLGTALIAWTEEVARRRRAAEPSDSDRLVGQTVPLSDAAALALFADRGYTLRHTSWVLRLPPDVELEQVPLPDGAVIRPARPGVEDAAVWQVVEDAFNEWPGREPSSFEDWAAEVVRRPGFEPWQLLVVDHDSEVVGACFVIVAGNDSWVQQLAVRRDRRGLGLGRALLSEAGRVSRERGAGLFELNTDSRTGALGLYEHVGMVVTDTFEHWALSAEPD